MNKAYYIDTINCESVSDGIFFVAYDMNLVLKYLIDRDEIVLLQPPAENMFMVMPYGNVVVLDKFIFLIPFYAKNIWKLCDNSKWEKISDPRLEQGKFMGAVLINNSIYLLGFWSKEIYKFNILTNQILELKIDISSEMSELDEVGFLGPDYEIVSGKIFVPVMCANIILEIDPERDIATVINVPGKSNGYSGIIYDGNGFWLAPRKGRYFVHYLLNGDIEEYELPEEYEEDEMYFGSAYREEEQIVFTAFNGKNFRFNTKFPKECEVFEPSIRYYKILNNKGKVIHERNGHTYYVDLNGCIRKLSLTISNKQRLGYIAKCASNKEILPEGDILSLKEYLQMVLMQ